MEPNFQTVVPTVRDIAGPLDETQARVVLREQERSGLSIGEYARRYNLPAPQMYRWRQRFEKRGMTSGVPDFKPVRLAENVAPPRPDAKAQGVVEIVYPTGPTVRILGDVDIVRLTAVLKAMGGASC